MWRRCSTGLQRHAPKNEKKDGTGVSKAPSLKANKDKDEAKIAEVERARADKKFPLGKGDKEILAAVLTNSTKPSPICLITMDGDFTRFVGEIRESIGIEIVSGFQD